MARTNTKRRRVLRKKKTRKTKKRTQYNIAGGTHDQKKNVKLKKMLLALMLLNNKGYTRQQHADHLGESEWKDIDFKTAKFYGVNKGTFKLLKEWIKDKKQQQQQYQPAANSHLPHVEIPNSSHDQDKASNEFLPSLLVTNPTPRSWRPGDMARILKYKYA